MTESKPRKGNATVLVVDDQEDVRQALSVLLSGEGYGVETADSPAAALEAMRQQRFGLVLFDMNYSRDTTSGREGLELLEAMLGVDDEVPMVAMTAWGSIELAVEALKRGAVDFLEKPWDNNRLLTILKTQLERRAALERAERLSRAAELEQRSRVADGIVAESGAMHDLLDMANRVAASDASILITGDNGVGKGMLAEQIHRWSSVADQVFVSVNMGSIPESLFEAEMFGHAKGAFTDAHEARAGRFELADGGTLFLDEVGNLPAAQQAKLLRVLETGKLERVGENRTRNAKVRLVAATNANLPEMVEDGEFRRDLYFRLNTIELDIPPLRDRPDDILPLAERFLSRSNRKYRRSAGFSDEARRALQAHSWPGNVRELAHAVERAVLLCGETPIEPGNLMLQPLSRRSSGPNRVQPLEELEKVAIEQALALFDGDVNRAAEALGLSRSAMYRRLEKYRIRSDSEPT